MATFSEKLSAIDTSVKKIIKDAVPNNGDSILIPTNTVKHTSQFYLIKQNDCVYLDKVGIEYLKLKDLCEVADYLKSL